MAAGAERGWQEWACCFVLAAWLGLWANTVWLRHVGGGVGVEPRWNWKPWRWGGAVACLWQHLTSNHQAFQRAWGGAGGNTIVADHAAYREALLFS